jgi:phage shock protein A
VTYVPITTQVDQHEEQLEELRDAVHKLVVRIAQMERLIEKITTAAIASTAAFDALRDFMNEQLGIEEVMAYDQDAEKGVDGNTYPTQ